MCLADECVRHEDCPSDKACVSRECIDPCRQTNCGDRAECRVVAHFSQCFCPAGLQGNPIVRCIPVGCQRDEDCGDREKCDYPSQRCVPLCTGNTCATGARCEAYNHRETCSCIPPLQGDGYVFCGQSEFPLLKNSCLASLTLFSFPPISAPDIDRPACYVDQDCPQQHSCFEGRCENPCQTRNPCQGNLECSVTDTNYGKRVVACSCPPGFVSTSPNYCEQGSDDGNFSLSNQNFIWPFFLSSSAARMH